MRASHRRARAWGSVRGASATEYTVLVGAVALGAAVALVGLGAALVSSFEDVRGFVLSPFP